MFDGQYSKYANDNQFYQDMMSWMEMERELSENDINEMERDSIEPLTVSNHIVSEVALNNRDYDNSNIGA
jgi:hypothetical protein